MHAVFHRAVELQRIAGEHDQPERGDQHHLEPDIEVEQIAGQEGAADASQQAAGAADRARREPRFRVRRSSG